MVENDSTKGLPVWLLLIVAALVASPVALSKDQASNFVAPPPAGGPDEKEEPEKIDVCQERFARVVADALLDGAPIDPPNFGGVVDALAAKDLEIEVLVATLPDPIDSGFGYMFQTDLHALLLGLEEHRAGDVSGGYFRAGEWLPWYDSTHKDSERCRDEVPGVVAFRGGVDGHAALVLVAGETPTSGIKPRALERALHLVGQLSAPPRVIVPPLREPVVSAKSSPPVRHALKILAPTFSGSVSSLKRSLQRFDGQGAWDVTIVSGTATSSNNKDELTDYVDEDGAGGRGWFDKGRVRFWTTVVPEEVLQCRYLAHLRWSLGEEPVNLRSAERGAQQLPRVAILHESGTQFGTSGTRAGACPLRPGFRAEFPANIAALRDAYETRDRSAEKRRTGVRATSLEISLRESRPLPGLRGAPSPKTVFAQDLALSRTIAALERQGVAHIGIQATEIADAIFISRKIRDVAPDIRVAFFQADTLLLHPDLRAMTGGSLVITPYPFLGASDLTFQSTDRAEQQAYRNFENTGAQGVFNATLALRGTEPEHLLEYVLFSDVDSGPAYSNLPVWVAAVGTTRFVPLAVSPSVLSHDVRELQRSPVYPGYSRMSAADLTGPGAWAEPTFANLSACSKGFSQGRWRDTCWKDPFIKLHESDGDLSRRKSSLPWKTLAFLAGLAFLVDAIRQAKKSEELAIERMPAKVEAKDERTVDWVAVRMKWRMYASVRKSLGVLTVAYMLFWAQNPNVDQPWEPLQKWGAALTMGLVVLFSFDVFLFLRDLSAYLNAKADESLGVAPPDQRLAVRFSRFFHDVPRDLGLMNPVKGISMARVSQCHAIILSLGVASTLVYLVVVHVRAFHEFSNAVGDVQSGWARVLMYERTLTLVGGVSVAAPTLLLVGVLYLWTRSRMSHLLLAHGVSRMTPADQVPDFVSTPIRLILYPAEPNSDGRQDDTAFTLVERTCVNSIIRPAMGPRYLLTFAGLAWLPFIAFAPATITTLERDLHDPLIVLLYIGYLLIISTILQLYQYWVSLDLLLKTTYQHPIGRAFSKVAAFVRESLDEMVSRTPNDLLRLAAAVGEYEKIQRWANKEGNTVAKDHLSDLKRRVGELALLREQALDSLGPHKEELRASRKAALGTRIVEATSELMFWIHKERSAAAAGATRKYSKEDTTWINDVEAFAATVVALLINRHVRQLQLFVYPLLVSCVFFLGAIVSYPFEPHRLMTSGAWGLLLVSAAMSVGVYLQLDRNSLLSDVASTDAGHITTNSGLVYRIFTWAVVPILAAIAADYPDLVHTVVKWIRPIPIWQ